jgi:cob(I)alamin adenosyltransferase
MSTTLMTALSVAEAVLLAVILAIALRQVARRLTRISSGLSTLAGALATVESQHLSKLSDWVADINRPLSTITGVLPGIAAKAALVVRKATGG